MTLAPLPRHAELQAIVTSNLRGTIATRSRTGQAQTILAAGPEPSGVRCAELASVCRAVAISHKAAVDATSIASAVALAVTSVMIPVTSTSAPAAEVITA